MDKSMRKHGGTEMTEQIAGKYRQGTQWVVWERAGDTLYVHEPTDYWHACEKVRAIRVQKVDDKKPS